jgi:hypothetical protein
MKTPPAKKLELEGSRLRFLDLTRPRPKHRFKHTRELAALAVDQEIVQDHSLLRTKFPTWIAQMRRRLGKPFRYQPMGGGKFRVWLEPGRQPLES